jgi:hypothetical protein
MNSGEQHAIVARALAAARVRALRMGLLALHQALIDAERERYERVNGRIESAQAALRLVMESPWFEWLHPLAGMIVQMDERLADERAIDVAEAEAFNDRVRGLLQREDAGARFRSEYRRALQEAPGVVLAHGHLARLVAAGQAAERGGS